MLAKIPPAAAAFAAVAVVASLSAQSAPPPIPTELRSRFGFVGPEITKIGFGIGGLQVADLDGDGRREAIVLDSRRARLTVLRTDGKASTQEHIPTNGQISGYAVADVTGDGKSELLVVDGRGRLAVRRLDGTTGTPIDLGIGTRSPMLRTGDLDGDGKQDLVAFARGSLRWVTQLGGTAVLSPLETIEENAYSFELLDFDGDGKLDLACVAPGPSMNLRLRRGRGDGTFGPWQIHGIDNLRYVWEVADGRGKAALATIEGTHSRATLRHYAPTGGQSALEWWPIENEGARTGPFAIGDVDGDGDEDLLLAQPERARLAFFEWRDGTFVLSYLPTLAGVGSLALGDVDGDGKQDLLLASAEEDTLAWKSGALPLGEFPVALQCVEKPIAVAVDPRGGALVLGRNEKRAGHLHRVRPGAAPELVADLGRLQADPARLIIADLGDADGLEAAFVVPNEGLRAVTLGAAPAAAAKDGAAAGFTKKLEDGAIELCLHDGKPSLLAVRERFVRHFRLDAAGQIRVLSQDNGPVGVTELSLSAELAGGGRLYLDKKSNKLVRVLGDAVPQSYDVPTYEFTHLRALGGAALLIGPRGVLRMPFGDGPSLTTIASQEAPTDRSSYWYGRTGDLDHDGRADLAIVDGRLPGLHVIARTDKGLERALSIPVYEAPPSGEPDNEPREVATGDLDGDGRCDLVLLAHDRILVYLQQP